MNLNKIYFMLINVISVIALIIISFLFTKEYTTIFWCSNVFTLIAFIVETTVITYHNKGGVKNYFFGLPITFYGGSYVIVQAIAGLTFSIWQSLDFKIGFVVQFLIFVVFVIMIIMSLTYKNTLEQKEETRKMSSSYMHVAASRLNSIASAISDREIKTEIFKLYEMAKMSNPLYSERLIPIESDIDGKISLLKEKSDNKDYAKKTINDIKNLINERNNICKVLKNEER